MSITETGLTQTIVSAPLKFWAEKGNRPVCSKLLQLFETTSFGLLFYKGLNFQIKLLVNHLYYLGFFWCNDAI